jgi:hypothetical protein
VDRHDDADREDEEEWELQMEEIIRKEVRDVTKESGNYKRHYPPP